MYDLDIAVTAKRHSSLPFVVIVMAEASVGALVSLSVAIVSTDLNHFQPEMLNFVIYEQTLCSKYDNAEMLCGPFGRRTCGVDVVTAGSLFDDIRIVSRRYARQIQHCGQHAFVRSIISFCGSIRWSYVRVIINKFPAHDSNSIVNSLNTFIDCELAKHK